MSKSKKALRIVKRILLVILAITLTLIFVCGIVLGGRIMSMASIKHIGGDLYTMNFHQNYYLDEALSSELKTEDQLLNFVCEKMFFGYGVDANLEKYACSAFITSAQNGDYLVGRNFELGGSDALSVYTHPKNGYASVSTVSTDIMGVGANSDIKTDDLYGRALMLAAPYLAVDGMNEKGLFAALLDLDPGEIHTDNGKPDLMTTLAVRLLIDRAANVEEAIELLGQYDMHSVHGVAQHLFLADARGNAAVIEWHRNEMKVVDSKICTNFRMSAKALEGDFSGQCDRFDHLSEALAAKNEFSPEEAMGLLEEVKQDAIEYGVFTEWSIVCDLTDFKYNICVDMDYDNMYSLNPRKY